MTEEIFTLPEMMLYADQFLCRVEAASKGKLNISDATELQLKIGQCRNLLVPLQNALNEDQLNFSDEIVQEEFRTLVLILHWIAFYARNVIDYRTFRRLVLVDAGFTRLLMREVQDARAR
jgi:hypothetical protein